MGRTWVIRMVLAAACVAALVAAGTAAATTLRVAATVHGRGARARLTIKRNGRTVYSHTVGSRQCGVGCILTPLAGRRSPLLEADLAGTGELDVVLGVYTGGAHCCFVDEIFTYDASRGRYVRFEHDFYDAGAAVKRIAGRWVFESANALVAEDALTDYADSGAPLQIWHLAGRRLVDVTRSYPALIRTDAARWQSAFRHHINNGVGFIAAWAADEDLLGHAALVRRTLDADARHGRLHSVLMPHVGGRSLESQLLKLLRQLGYTK